MAYHFHCKQDSPPAWTQEAHRLPHSKCSLCWLGGVVPHPVLDGGYPIQSWRWGSTPIQSWRGVPNSADGEGYPGVPQSQVWTGGTPFWSWMGYPHPISRIGCPPSGPEMGYPRIQTWDGVPPAPPQVWTDWNYYLPSSFGCGRQSYFILNTLSSETYIFERTHIFAFQDTVLCVS